MRMPSKANDHNIKSRADQGNGQHLDGKGIWYPVLWDAKWEITEGIIFMDDQGGDQSGRQKS